MRLVNILYYVRLLHIYDNQNKEMYVISSCTRKRVEMQYKHVFKNA